MKKMNLLIGILLVLVLAGLVYAATLEERKKVDWCVESDGGFNINQSGNVTYSLRGNITTVFDYCINPYTIGEYQCVHYPFQFGGELLLWSENCTCVNGTCV